MFWPGRSETHSTRRPAATCLAASPKFHRSGTAWPGGRIVQILADKLTPEGSVVPAFGTSIAPLQKNA